MGNNSLTHFLTPASTWRVAYILINKFQTDSQFKF